MTRIHSFTVFAILVLLCAVSSARADTILIANLTTSQNPGVVLTNSITGNPRPESFGTAVFVLNDARTSMSFSAAIVNIDVTGTQTADLNDDLLAAHIHAPAPPGSNAGVVWGFFGAPFNDNTPNDFMMTPFANGVGGMFSGKWDAPEGNNTMLTTQVPNILAGLSYINFHTFQNRGGEIRGQIQPIPEPATMLLLGTGLAGIGGMIRKRRKVKTE